MKETIRLYVDFNSCENPRAIRLRFDIINKNIDRDLLHAGMRLIIYDEDIECEAILRHGVHVPTEWVAEIVESTIKPVRRDRSHF
jgi:hypothetical protein